MDSRRAMLTKFAKKGGPTPLGKGAHTAVMIPRVANRNPDWAAELPRKVGPPAQIYFFLVSLPFFAVVSADFFDADSFAAR